MDFPHEKEYPEGYISVRHPEFDDCFFYVRMNICFMYPYWVIEHTLLTQAQSV